MAKRRTVIPVKLLASAVTAFALSFVAKPAIQALATPEQISENVLLIAFPTILVFVAIVLGYIAVIVFAGKLLEDRISESLYRPIEYVLIGGIVLGVFGLFQPWLFVLFRVGFFVLLFSTLGFILWSHILFKRTRR